MKKQIYAKNNRSLHLLVGIVIIATIAASCLGWLTFRSFDDFQELQKKHKEVVRIQGEVMLYDEVLTMSARMAAATGDIKWEERYRLFEPQLDKAIKRLVELQPRGVKSVEETDAANIALVEMELQAFAFIHKKQQEKAFTILFNDRYQKQKSIYLEGISKLYKNIDLEYGKEWAKHKEKISWLKITLFLLFGISAFGWLYIFQKIRLWNQELYSFNNKLDEKVKEQSQNLITSSKMSALGEMAGGVAHEINNPLATIKILSEQLQEELEEDSLDRSLLKDMVSKIGKTTNRIAKIIQGLRSFSRDQR